MKATIIAREGKDPRYPWKQFFIVGDERVIVVEMTPALLAGWNIARVSVQGPTDWPSMSHDTILAWKRRDDDGYTDFAPDINPEFQAKLRAIAAGA
jgi:hypothetical protein